MPSSAAARVTRRVELARLHAAAGTHPQCLQPHRVCPISRQQFAGAICGALHAVRVYHALETIRGFRAQFQQRGTCAARKAGRNAPTSIRMSIVFSSTSDSAPPITPATATGFSASAMTSMSVVSVRVFAVQGCDRFAVPRPPDNDSLARQFVQIKRVKRLPHFQHHVIGHIHDIVDGPLPCRFQSRLHPCGRRPDFHAPHQPRRIARAQIRRLQSSRTFAPPRRRHLPKRAEQAVLAADRTAPPLPAPRRPETGNRPGSA